MKKAIASIAFKRPDYFKQHLEGLLSQNWKRDTDYFVFIDGPKNENDIPAVAEVSKLARDFINKHGNCFPHYFMDEQELNRGCDYQILHAVKNILIERGYDQVIIVEEDVIPLRGFLEWMEFGLDMVREKRAQSVCAFNQPTNVKEDPLAYKSRKWFTPWGWATTREAWQKTFSDWKGDPEGWDWCVARTYKRSNLHEIYPIVPRTKNVGKIGFHQDGVTKYPELEERLTTSNDYPLATAKFHEKHEMEYTVISLFYNQHDRLEMMRNTWMSQQLKPREIIILDDGSQIPPNPSWARVISFQHTMNLARMSNFGVREIETPYYIITSPDLLYSSNFAMVSLLKLKKTPGRVCFVGRHANMDKITPQLPPPPIVYANNTKIQGWMPACPTAWMEKKENFLGFCEEFKGWGQYDDDYAFRFINAGGSYIACNQICMWHLNHGHDKEFMDCLNNNIQIFARRKNDGKK